MKKKTVVEPKKRVWKGVFFIFFGLVIVSIPLYRQIKTYYHYKYDCYVAFGHRTCPELKKNEACPSDKPYIISSEKKYGYYELELVRLDDLEELYSLRKKEIPDFEFADICEAYPEPGCERLDDIKKEQQAILEWNQSPAVLSVEEQNREIQLINDEISNENINISQREENDQKRFILLLLKSEESMGIHTLTGNGGWSYISPISFKDTPLRSVLYDYLDKVDKIMAQNKFDVEERIKENAEIIIKNEEIKKKNQEIIQKNEQALQTAKEYWTIEKKKELLDNYGDFIKNNCVDCNYTGGFPDLGTRRGRITPGSMTPGADCRNSCPNRKYVDGYCVLK